MPQNFLDIALLVILGWIAYIFVEYHRLVARLGRPPGYVLFLAPSVLGRLLPSIPYVVQGPIWEFDKGHKDFKRANADIFFGVCLFPFPRVFHMEFADPAALKEIFTNRTAFPKPWKKYGALSLFGPNIIVSEDEEWKRHRKIVAPSFSEKNNLMVYQETTKIILGLFEHWEEQGHVESVTVPNMADVTFEIAMMVIAAAGFGTETDWKDNGKIPPGHRKSFKKTLADVCLGMYTRMVFSDGLLDMWEDGKTTKEAFKEMEVYMKEMIEDRRQFPKERADLFSNLLSASSGENALKGGDALFSDADLKGNIFIFLLAGHETTAHALGFAFGLLAIHEDVQEKLYEEIKETVRSGGVPTYSEVTRMKYLQAIFNETIRVYPLAHLVPKISSHETTFRTTSNDGKNTPLTITAPAGMIVLANIPATHFNPKYWPEPREFKPERFFGDYNRDAFIPFSGGPRACIGRRFSEIEAYTVLTMMVQRYRITVTPDAAFAHEDFAERKARVLKAIFPGVTLSPAKVPLTFTRR